MKQKSKGFFALDVLYLALTIIPLVVGIVIKVLTTPPPGEGVSISGALIYFEIPMPIQNLVITESQINSWLVMIAILGLCLYMTHGLNAKIPTKRQHIAEMCVQMCDKMVIGRLFTIYSRYTFPFGIFQFNCPFRTVRAYIGHKHCWRMGTFSIYPHNLLQVKMRTTAIYQKSGKSHSHGTLKSHRRICYPYFNGVPSLRKCAVRLGNICASCYGTWRSFQYVAWVVTRIFGRISIFKNRYSRYLIHIF